MHGGYFWKGEGRRGEGRGMVRRRETVIHTCTISERLVRIKFATGVGLVDTPSDFTQVCNLTGLPIHTH